MEAILQILRRAAATKRLLNPKQKLFIIKVSANWFGIIKESAGILEEAPDKIVKNFTDPFSDTNELELEVWVKIHNEDKTDRDFENAIYYHLKETKKEKEEK